MSEEEILEVLESENEHLNTVTKTYLLSSLDRPILGYQKFNDIKSTLLYGLNEYRITNHQENGYDYEKKTLGKLYKQFSISSTELKKFIEGINSILKSYTDNGLSTAEKRNTLEKQIKRFTKKRNDSTQRKMHNRLEVQRVRRKRKDQEPKNKKEIYLDSILERMQTAKLNTIKDNEYMVITSLFEIYDEHQQYLEDFNQIKKDLIKAIKKHSMQSNMSNKDCLNLIETSFTDNCKEVLDFIDVLHFFTPIESKKLNNNNTHCQEIKSICNNPNYNNSTSHSEIISFCKKIQKKQNNSVYDTLSNYIHKIYIETLQKMDIKNSSITNILDSMTNNNYLESLEKIERIVSDTDNENLIDEYIKTTKKKAFQALTWFVFYLLYGKNKFSIYAIHSILGEYNPDVKELYLKLFLKDRKTADNSDFKIKYNYSATVENTIVYKEPYHYNEFYKTIINKLMNEIEAKKSKK